MGGLAFSYDLTRTAIRFDTNGNVTTPGERVRRLALVNAAGHETDVLAEQGQVVGDPHRPIRVVTLNFLANPQAASPGLGGDGYPFPAYAEDLVDLTKVLTDAGLASFAAPGSEQDALAEFLKANYAATPYALEDTDLISDYRIVNLVAMAPVVTGLALTADRVEILLPTVAGRLYVVEHAEEVAGPWEALPSGLVRGDGQVARVQDSGAGFLHRFYRVSLVE